MLLGCLKNRLNLNCWAELVLSEITDFWSDCWIGWPDWALWKRWEPLLFSRWVWIKIKVLVIAEIGDIEIPLGKAVEAVKIAVLEDDDLDTFKLFEMFSNLGSELTDLDLTEVHFFQLLDLILVLLEPIFDLLECAHSKFLILWSIYNLNLKIKHQICTLLHF